MKWPLAWNLQKVVKYNLINLLCFSILEYFQQYKNVICCPFSTLEQEDLVTYLVISALIYKN